MRSLLLAAVATLALGGSAMADDDLTCLITDNAGNSLAYGFTAVRNADSTAKQGTYIQTGMEKNDQPIESVFLNRPRWSAQSSQLYVTLTSQDDPSWSIRESNPTTMKEAIGMIAQLLHRGVAAGIGSCFRWVR
jgi:hypothetical protein